MRKALCRSRIVCYVEMDKRCSCLLRRIVLNVLIRTNNEITVVILSAVKCDQLVLDIILYNYSSVDEVTGNQYKCHLANS